MNITKREKEVIKKLSEGLTTKEVARDLFLSPYTIEAHKRNIFQKMQARTLVQLGALAVRHGIIAMIFICGTSNIHAQSEMEVEGSIKTNIIELKDESGDVRFRWDANTGLYQVLSNGDTLREVFYAQIEQAEQGSKINGVAKSVDPNSVRERAKEMFNSARNTLNSVRSKISAALGVTISEELSDITDLEKFDYKIEGLDGSEIAFADGVPFTTENVISGTFFYDENDNLTHADICIASLFSCGELEFDDGKLISLSYANLFGTGDKTIKFEDKDGVCNIIYDESGSKIVTYNPENNTLTSLDGKTIGSFSTEEELNSFWACVDAQGNGSFGVGNQNNQFAAKPEYSVLFQQHGNNVKQVMNDVNGIQFAQDEDISNPDNPIKILGIQFDTTNNRNVICGDLHVKGNVTATGNIDEMQTLMQEITKSHQKLIAENLGSGNVITNENGLASVTLPKLVTDNFSDYRYQLTVIGSFNRAIISKEISNQTFEIKTDAPGVKVSWELKGQPNPTLFKRIKNTNVTSLEREMVRMEQPIIQK